jgi:iron complex outermembrane receptor protein
MSVALWVVLAGTSSLAQDDVDPWAGVEELIVTGNGSALLETIVPSSNMHFDAELLQAERIQSVGDIAAFTPNLQINTAFAASNPVIFIRGVGLDDFNANSASAVAVYQDGVYMNSPAGQLFQFFDTKGVNVLRGPQAGPYRNASAGAILIEANPPVHEYAGSASFTYGNFFRREAEGFLNIPIVPDLFAMRVSGKWTEHSGYTRNRCGGQPYNRPQIPRCNRPIEPFIGYQLGFPAPNPKNVNDADNWAARAMFLLDIPLPASEMSWVLNLHGGQNKSLATQFQNRSFQRTSNSELLRPGLDRSRYQDTDGDPFAGDYNSIGNEDLDLYGANLKGTWDLTYGHVIKSVTGFEFHDRETLQNSDGNDRNLLAVLFTDKAWQASQDLQIESDWSENFRTTLGGYFIMENLIAFNVIDQPANRARTQSQDFRQHTRSFSFFGTLSWDLPHRLKFDGDVRYTQEYKQFENEARFIVQSNNCTANEIIVPWGSATACELAPANSGIEEDTFQGMAGSVSLTYDFTEDETKSVYAKYSRGWKPGHFNGGAFLSRQLIEPVRPEKIDAFEVGFRTTWFDGLMKFNGAAFYYDFEDLQVFQIESDGGVGPVPQLINAKGARVFGAEVDLEAEPIEGLAIRFSAAFLDTEYDEFESTISTKAPPRGDGTPGIVTILPVDYTGNTMVGAPQWSLSASVQYDLALTFRTWDLGVLTPRFSASFKDDVFFDVAEGRGVRSTPQTPNLPTGTIGQEAYWVLNASLTWDLPGDRLQLRAWMKNLADEAYRVQSFDLTDPNFNVVIDAYAPPRTIGITLTATF